MNSLTAIKQCSSPERHLGVQIENAGSFSIGSVLNYSCAFGYVLKGNNTRECLSTGMWSGEPPQCFHNGELSHTISYDKSTNVTEEISCEYFLPETLHQKAELTLDTTG